MVDYRYTVLYVSLVLRLYYGMPIESVTVDPQCAAAHSGHAQGSWRCPECGLVPRDGPWPENIATAAQKHHGQAPGTARQRGAARREARDA